MKKFLNPRKRINVILSKDIEQQTENGPVTRKAGDVVMRTTRSLAAKMIDGGNYSHTKKGKLKSFMKRDMKLRRNMEEVKRIEAMTGTEVRKRRDSRGRVYAIVPTFRHTSLFGREEVTIKRTQPNSNRRIKHRQQTEVRYNQHGLPYIHYTWRDQFIMNFVKVITMIVMMKVPKKKGDKVRVEETGTKRLILSYE